MKQGKEAKRWLKFRKQFLKGREDWAKRYICELCFIPTDYPEVDHIKKRSSHPELKYVKSNLRILCRPCHIKETAKKP